VARKIYCSYCKEEITPDQKRIKVEGKFYHYDQENYLNTCYFPDEYEIDEDDEYEHTDEDVEEAEDEEDEDE